MYYDKKGKKIEMMEWAKLLEQDDYKIVKQETLPDGKFVSTVWLGLDYNFDGRSKPIIFETMVFSGKKETFKLMGRDMTLNHGDEVDIDRYSTLKEALVGHDKMVFKYTNKLKKNV